MTKVGHLNATRLSHVWNIDCDNWRAWFDVLLQFRRGEISEVGVPKTVRAECGGDVGDVLRLIGKGYENIDLVFFAKHEDARRNVFTFAEGVMSMNWNSVTFEVPVDKLFEDYLVVIPNDVKVNILSKGYLDITPWKIEALIPLMKRFDSLLGQSRTKLIGNLDIMSFRNRGDLITKRIAKHTQHLYISYTMLDSEAIYFSPLKELDLTWEYPYNEFGWMDTNILRKYRKLERLGLHDVGLYNANLLCDMPNLKHLTISYHNHEPVIERVSWIRDLEHVPIAELFVDMQHSKPNEAIIQVLLGLKRVVKLKIFMKRGVGIENGLKKLPNVDISYRC